MIGSTLRAEREKKGLTIAEIEKETSIRGRYLEALEQGKYDELPNEVYVKGFIRNYAEYLGLDAGALVQAYREEIYGEDVKPAPPPVPETTSLVNEHAPFSSGSDFHERVEKSHRKQMIFAMAATVLIAFVGSIYYFFGEDPDAVKKPAAQTQQTQQTNSRTAQRPDQPTPQTTPATQPPTGGVMNGSTASAAAGPVDLAVKFTARCWVQVVADGKTIYEDMAEANESKRWSGRESVVVTAGNAGAIEVTYNGQNVGKLGKTGEVVEKRFAKGKVEDVK